MRRRLLAMGLLVLFYLFCFPSDPGTLDLQDYARATKKVEVKGEVLSPGVYEVAWDADVETILEAAGGAGDDADLSGLSLAADIGNQSVLVVPQKQKQQKISINSATLEELDTLPGVGPSIAQRIIDYRTEKPFASIEELKEVKGIGDKVFAKLQEHIAL